MEIWKYIEGCEGIYQVSNYGDARSVNRAILHWAGGRSNIIGRKLKPHINSNGYKQIVLSIKGKTKSVILHKLVANTFIKKSKNNLQVNHIDGNKLNNFVSNLEFVTAKDNMLHAYKIGLRNNGSKHHLSKLTETKVLLIRKKYKPRTVSCAKLASEFGVSRGCVSAIINRYSWNHI